MPWLAQTFVKRHFLILTKLSTSTRLINFSHFDFDHIFPARWEPLLLPSFSGPTLEQDGDTPSYGLLLALANVSVRTLARDGASQRSPSPGR